jgi:hypothetical protein
VERKERSSVSSQGKRAERVNPFPQDPPVVVLVNSRECHLSHDLTISEKGAPINMAIPTDVFVEHVHNTTILFREKKTKT